MYKQQLKRNLSASSSRLNQVEMNEMENEANRSGGRDLSLIEPVNGQVEKRTTQARQESLQVKTSLVDDESSGGLEPVAREQWARKTEFLLAIIGFSVDLGNIWRCLL